MFIVVTTDRVSGTVGPVTCDRYGHYARKWKSLEEATAYATVVNAGNYYYAGVHPADEYTGPGAEKVCGGNYEYLGR